MNDDDDDDYGDEMYGDEDDDYGDEHSKVEVKENMKEFIERGIDDGDFSFNKDNNVQEVN